MKSLSSIGLGLSIVFGCFFLALIAEFYYLLWWKKRLTSRDLENNCTINPAREFFYMFCWKKSASSMADSALNPQEIRLTEEQQSNKDLLVKPNFDDYGMENELMRPRFLFTIIEETKEDLESIVVETPYLTPLNASSSPPFLTPPLTPMDACNYSHQGGFNPLFESETDAEFNRIIRSSPPPKFKFLQEAEEKLLHRKKFMEEEEVHKNDGFGEENGNGDDMINPPSKYLKDEEEDGSFITIFVDRNKEIRGFNQFHSKYYFSGTSS